MIATLGAAQTDEIIPMFLLSVEDVPGRFL